MSIRFKLLLLFLVVSGCATHTQFTRSNEYIKKHGYDHIYPGLVEKLEAYSYPKQGEVNFVHKKIQLQNKSFCFVGDTGNNSANQKKVALELKKSCDQIFHMGDIVYPLGVDSEHDPELKEKFLKHYSPFTSPFYLSMGNHDYLNSSYSVDPWYKISRMHRNLYFPHPYYGLNLSGVCVIAIDSVPIQLKIQNLTEEQARWLTSIEKNEFESCQTKILFTHYPYRTPYSRRDKKAIRKGWRLKFYEEHIIGKYDLLFSGHDHILSYVGRFKGTDQYITGAGGKATDVEKIKSFQSISENLHKGPGFIKMSFEEGKPGSFVVEIIAFEDPLLSKTISVIKKDYHN